MAGPGGRRVLPAPHGGRPPHRRTACCGSRIPLQPRRTLLLLRACCCTCAPPKTFGAIVATWHPFSNHPFFLPAASRSLVRRGFLHEGANVCRDISELRSQSSQVVSASAPRSPCSAAVRCFTAVMREPPSLLRSRLRPSPRRTAPLPQIRNLIALTQTLAPCPEDRTLSMRARAHARQTSRRLALPHHLPLTTPLTPFRPAPRRSWPTTTTAPRTTSRRSSRSAPTARRAPLRPRRSAAAAPPGFCRHLRKHERRPSPSTARPRRGTSRLIPGCPPPRLPPPLPSHPPSAPPPAASPSTPPSPSAPPSAASPPASTTSRSASRRSWTTSPRTRPRGRASRIPCGDVPRLGPCACSYGGLPGARAGPLLRFATPRLTISRAHAAAVRRAGAVRDGHRRRHGGDWGPEPRALPERLQRAPRGRPRRRAGGRAAAPRRREAAEDGSGECCRWWHTLADCSCPICRPLRTHANHRRRLRAPPTRRAATPARGRTSARAPSRPSRPPPRRPPDRKSVV